MSSKSDTTLSQLDTWSYLVKSFPFVHLFSISSPAPLQPNLAKFLTFVMPRLLGKVSSHTLWFFSSLFLRVPRSLDTEDSLDVNENWERGWKPCWRAPPSLDSSLERENSSYCGVLLNSVGLISFEETLIWKKGYPRLVREALQS